MSEDLFQIAFDHLRQESPKATKEAWAILNAALKQSPKNAKVNFEYAGAYDFLGEEKKACVYYEKVQSLGVQKLPLEDQACFYVQYGSTLRNLEAYKKAEAVFETGIEQFPSFLALKLFLALNACSMKHDVEKNKAFLKMHIDDPKEASVKRYLRSLKNYFKLLS